MDASMKKRKVGLKDIPMLISMRKEQLIDEGLPPISDIDKSLNDYYKTAIENDSFVCFVMEVDGKVVATSGVCFYTLTPKFSNPTGGFAYITSMYTKKDYRERGIAFELLSSVINEARSRGYKNIRLHTSENNKIMYEKAGFKDMIGFMSLKL